MQANLSQPLGKTYGWSALATPDLLKQSNVLQERCLERLSVAIDSYVPDVQVADLADTCPVCLEELGAEEKNKELLNLEKRFWW